MALAYWQRKNPLPTLPSLSNIRITPTKDVDLLSRMAKLSPAEVKRRVNAGNVPYLAWFGQFPAAYGWSARQSADIGELDLAFTLRPAEVYLWDFATLPHFRGRGIYPHLLQGIFQQESADQFWIIHAPENRASSRGISHAGFQSVAELSFIKWEGGAGIYAPTVSETALMGAALLKLPFVEGEGVLASCWSCTLSAMQQETFIPPVCWSDTCCCTNPC